jgi:hypothetical protein
MDSVFPPYMMSTSLSKPDTLRTPMDSRNKPAAMISSGLRRPVSAASPSV